MVRNFFQYHKDCKKRKHLYFYFFINLGEEIDENTNEPVEGGKDEIRQDPFTLPSGFIWDTLDLNNKEIVSIKFWIYFFQGLIQDLDLGSDMNVSSN